MKTIDASHFVPVTVPRKVAICPICGADIVIEDVSEWICESGIAVSISIDCTSEPDIDSDEWPDWHRGHWSMPYVDWLPVENRVKIWFQANYRIT